MKRSDFIRQLEQNGSILHGLYAITSPLSRGSVLLNQVQQAIAGGAKLVQYRDKGQAGAKRKTEAAALLKLCHTYQVPLIINDDIELAYAIAADGVHLGRDDPAIFTARKQLGSQALIGISCYNNLNLALQAQAAGANYVAFGRFFTSTTKPDATMATIELLHQAKTCLHLPIVAIGGITAENGKLLVDAGADMLAVIGALFSVPNIQTAAAAISNLYAVCQG